ncbi:hypothetical protein [Spirosoma fluviale]|nr:hypothetical protein [Spirosoma fluviale]
MKRELGLLLLLASLILSGSIDCLAQRTFQHVTDSLVTEGIIRKTGHSLYIKPIFEQYQPLITVVGDGFSVPKGELTRKRGVGIRMGYRGKRFELETGLSTIRPAVGYRYLLNGPYAYGHTTRTVSTDFYHIPLLFRYRLWQPVSKLSLRIGTGIAYNVDLDKLKLAPISNSEESSLDANGNKVVLARTRSQYERKKSFFSAEVNLSTQYQFSPHFSASLEVRRLFSPKDVVRITATQQTFDPPAFRDIEANGGANSLNLNLGIAYHFRVNNRYRLN